MIRPPNLASRPAFDRALAVLAFLLAWAAFSQASPSDGASATRFFGPLPEDRGGDLPTYINAVAAANRSGALVVIEGTCVSACTIKLAAKNRCVRADAILWFHSASEGSAASEIGNIVLIDSYPPRIRDEVLRRHMLDDVEFDPDHTLTGRELIELGEKECPRRTP
jgi:hypothetical protein